MAHCCPALRTGSVATPDNIQLVVQAVDLFPPCRTRGAKALFFPPKPFVHALPSFIFQILHVILSIQLGKCHDCHVHVRFVCFLCVFVFVCVYSLFVILFSLFCALLVFVYLCLLCFVVFPCMSYMVFYGFRVLVVENTARPFGTGHVCHEDWERFLREKIYTQKSFCFHATYTLLSPKRAPCLQNARACPTFCLISRLFDSSRLCLTLRTQTQQNTTFPPPQNNGEERRTCLQLKLA